MDPDGLLSRIAPYAACCIVSALVFLILGWAAAKKGARLPGWPPALPDRAEAPVGARSWRAGRFGVSPPSPGRK